MLTWILKGTTKLGRHIHQHEWRVYEHPSPRRLFTSIRQTALAKETLQNVSADSLWWQWLHSKADTPKNEKEMKAALKMSFSSSYERNFYLSLVLVSTNTAINKRLEKKINTMIHRCQHHRWYKANKADLTTHPGKTLLLWPSLRVKWVASWQQMFLFPLRGMKGKLLAPLPGVFFVCLFICFFGWSIFFFWFVCCLLFLFLESHGLGAIQVRLILAEFGSTVKPQHLTLWYSEKGQLILQENKYKQGFRVQTKCWMYLGMWQVHSFHLLGGCVSNSMCPLSAPGKRVQTPAPLTLDSCQLFPRLRSRSIKNTINH